MIRLGLLAFAVQSVPRIFQIRRRTWIALSVGLLVLFGLTISAVVALIIWFFGQAQGLTGSAQELLADPARGVMQQVEQVVPAAREQLDKYLDGLLPAQKDEAGSLRNNNEEAEQ
jgi:predicted PurR-regulated permease PerM